MKHLLSQLLSDFNTEYLPNHWCTTGEASHSPVRSSNGNCFEEFTTLEKTAGNCQACALSQNRNNVVFGFGNLDPDICFIGEAPGAEEDSTGEPFVGPAGLLLSKAIESGMGLKREDVYLCNLVKCRPPDDREPDLAEVSSCIGFLERQIELLKPKVIVTLGGPAQKALAGPDRGGPEEGITKVRGNWLDYRGIPLMPTFHPAYLLKKPGAKKEFWQDLLSVMDFLGINRPS